MSDQQIRDQFETNVFGLLNVTRAVIFRKQKKLSSPQNSDPLSPGKFPFYPPTVRDRSPKSFYISLETASKLNLNLLILPGARSAEFISCLYRLLYCLLLLATQESPLLGGILLTLSFLISFPESYPSIGLLD
ncbi:MAG TPA: hypothetical protein V6C85_21175 [Allocoleopsis sp.]